MNSYELNNKVKISSVGLGIWLIDDKKVKNVVKDAINVGYRHIDTA